jgi:hypothetical protein
MATLAEIDAEIARRQQAPSLADIDAEIARRQQAQGQPQIPQGIPGVSDVAAAAPVEPENMGALDTAIGAANLVNIAGTKLGERAVSGVGGIVQSLNPFAGEGAGAAASKQIADIIPDMPLTSQGQQLIKTLSEQFNASPEIVQHIGRQFMNLDQNIGDRVFDATGNPLAATIARSLPEALEAATGGGARVAKSLAAADLPLDNIVRKADDASVNAQKAQRFGDATDVIKAGEKAGVPVLTTDVAPPTSFLGKFTQGLSEKLGPLGSGTARQTQQIARQNIVESLARDFGVALDSSFASDIVGSLNAKSARKMQGAMMARNKAVSSLDTFGEVSVDKTVQAIDAIIAKQSRLGAKADSALVTNMQNTREAIQGGDFSLVKDIRTDIIDDLIAVRKGDDFRSEGALQSVKSAIDKDMARFASANDKAAGTNWRAANRNLAEELGLAKETELRRIFKSGTATPEQVLPLLTGGKRSQLGRLKTSLGSKGVAAAKGAIIQDALKQSGFLSDNINPDRLATALNRPQTKQAIDIFFSGDSKAEISGLTKLLDATRRAQQAALSPATGVQNLPLIGATGLGASATVAPLTTIVTATTLSGIAKAYESKGFRNLLLKLGNMKQGSKAETKLLESVAPAVAASLLAAKTEQEEQ